jgi:hypothetical protein
MGSATEVVRYRKEKNGRIIEVVIWRLSDPVPGSFHRFKYRLFYGMADGTCLVRYDNERGKGDHRHIGDQENDYHFTTLRKLIDDFETDTERM